MPSLISQLILYNRRNINGIEEEWRTVIGFDNYMISNKGYLKRIGNNGKEYYLSTTVFDKDGYVKTSMNKNGKRHYLRLHRIVAENFIPNPNNLPVVNHKNGIKYDNRVENLEWCTISENTKHGFEVLGRVGHNGGMNKVVYIIYDDGKVLKFNTQKACGEFLNVSEVTIGNYIKYPNRLNGKNYIIVRDYEGVTTIENTCENKEVSRVDWDMTPIEAQGDIF